MKQSGIRWWPLSLVGLLWLGLLVWTWGFDSGTGQTKVTLTIATTFLALLLALGWLLLLSRLPWRRRLAYFGLTIGLLVLFGSTLRIRDVTGDLVPVLGWRWSVGGNHGEAAEAVELRGPIADYPQFLGPDRNATVSGIALARDWSTEPPRELWRRSMGEGWSAFAVADRFAVTQEQRDDEELVAAYELTSGRKIWEHADEARYETTLAGVGPRATPTIVDDRVFTLGATGRLNCLELETGRSLWSRDVVADFNSAAPEWGRPGSPLVVDELVVVTVGGSPDASLVAFDASNGDVVWTAGQDRVGYSSPIVVTLAGRRQIVIFNRASVAGHDVATGRVLWSFPWSARQPNVALPLVIGDDRLLVSSGYGEGSKLLRLKPADDRLAADLLWESPRLKAKFTNVVLHDGFVYGLDDGVLICLDPETGERCWKRGRYGHGQVILVDGLLLVQTEGGDVVLVEPTPEEHRELGRFTAFDDKTWNPPALVGRHLLLRNHHEAALYELPIAGG
jgi:outer membrane protein assembly factor BamB